MLPLSSFIKKGLEAEYIRWMLQRREQGRSMAMELTTTWWCWIELAGSRRVVGAEKSAQRKAICR